MVSRSNGIVAENLGARAEPRRAVAEPHEVHVEDWFDSFLVEEAAKFESRDEIRHEVFSVGSSCDDHIPSQELHASLRQPQNSLGVLLKHLGADLVAYGQVVELPEPAVRG